MSNIESLYGTLTGLKNISNKDELVVFYKNRIITKTSFQQEIESYKKKLESAGIDDYPNFPKVEQCQQELRDRVITLGLPLENTEQEITANFLEKNIKIKIADKYQKHTNNTREEIIFVIDKVLEENPEENNITRIDHLINSKLKQSQKIEQNQPLIGQIKVELATIATTRWTEELFSLNIDDEINILQNSSKEQLKEILKLLKQKNQTSQLDHALAMIYNKNLDSHEKMNVSLADFKKNSNILIDAGYALHNAYELIKDTAKASSNSEEFNEKMASIFTLVDHIKTTTIDNYKQLSKEKKCFITQFQFEQAIKHFLFLGFDLHIAIQKLLKVVKNSNNFTSFYGEVHMTASADAEKRGYVTTVQIENIYNNAEDKLANTGKLSLLTAHNSTFLIEEQNKRTREDFEKYVDELSNTSTQDTNQSVFLSEVSRLEC